MIAEFKILSGQYKGYIATMSNCGEWLVTYSDGKHRDIAENSVYYIEIE